MTNQNFSTSTTSDFHKVIAFLQPPYEHSNNCLQVKQDIAELCQKKNLNLLAAIDFKDPCDQQALNRLVELVKYFASNRPIILMINEEMVATPANVPFWSVIGTLKKVYVRM